LFSANTTSHKPDDVMACLFWTIADIWQVTKKFGNSFSDEEAADILDIVHEF